MTSPSNSSSSSPSSPLFDPNTTLASVAASMFGKLGGQSKSKRKLAAVNENLKLAWKARRKKAKPKSAKAAKAARAAKQKAA